jgi:hypothetical protein
MSHYLLLGFHKIVIMDNTISGKLYDDFMVAVEPFIKLGLVEVIPIPEFHTHNAFEACRKKVERRERREGESEER